MADDFEFSDAIKARVEKTVATYGAQKIIENASKTGIKPKLRGKIVLIPLDGKDFESCRQFCEISLGVSSYRFWWPKIYEKNQEGYYPCSYVHESKIPEDLKENYLFGFQRRWDALESLLNKHD